MLRRWAGLFVGSSNPSAIDASMCVPESSEPAAVAPGCETTPPELECDVISNRETSSTYPACSENQAIPDDDIELEGRGKPDETMRDTSADPQEIQITRTCSGSNVAKGTIFSTLSEAKELCTQFAQCPIRQTSEKHYKYVTFLCFRSGAPAKYESQVDEEFQRTKWSSRIECPFKIRLKQTATNAFEVTELSTTHNHELFESQELQQLSQNRHIPDEVKEKILSLNGHGVLTCAQIMCLIENDHFLDLAVTWTKRDVQNLIQQHSNRKQETHEFVSLLNGKRMDDWQVQSNLTKIH